MSSCNRDIRPRNPNRPRTNGNNCDIFEPSTYTPESAKYRADYIKRITAKITAELDASLIAEEVPEGEEPTLDLEVTGVDPEKNLKFTAKYLRGPRGFNGSVDNFVVLTEAEYERLRIKDPNKFYYTYEGTENPGYVESSILYVNDVVDGTIMLTSAQIESNILVM